MRFPPKITSSYIWVAIPVDWVILHWYTCVRTNGRSVGRCTVTWLPNFLKLVDSGVSVFVPLWFLVHLLSYGAPRVELRYNSPGAWIHLLWFLSCFLLLWYFALVKKKHILGFRDYIFRREFLVPQVFPGRGTLPYLALMVMCPWAGHGFQGLGGESFTTMWRLDTSSLHLWYQQFLTKKSNSAKMLVWKLLTSVCETKWIRALIYGIFS